MTNIKTVSVQNSEPDVATIRGKIEKNTNTNTTYTKTLAKTNTNTKPLPLHNSEPGGSTLGER